MQIATRLICARKFLEMVAVLACLLSGFAIFASAQGTKGQNAVYPPSGVCCKGSPAFIDASRFLGNSQGVDLCDTINGILGNRFGGTYPSSGAIIDARGISGSALTCTLGSPWSEGSTSVSAPSTILLPAGTVTIPGTWALPSNTKLIGEGYGTTGGTVILACTTSTCPANFPTGSPMIQFGTISCGNSAPICYTGISVENLMLNGNAVNGVGQNIIGIANFTAQSSYVDHVTMFQILGTGLEIGAPGSGPYTNITFNAGSSRARTPVLHKFSLL